MSKSAVFILTLVLSTTARAADWMEYPIQAEFGSSEICNSVAENMDIEGGHSGSSIYVSCKGKVLVGTIGAGSDLKSVNLQIIWPKGIELSCDQASKDLQKASITAQVNCKTITPPTPPHWLSMIGTGANILSFGITDKIKNLIVDNMNQWNATFAFTLKNGKPVDQVQAEKFAAREREEALEEQRESNPAITNETGSGKGVQTTGSDSTVQKTHAGGF